jgi:hypothetical protein
VTSSRCSSTESPALNPPRGVPCTEGASGFGRARLRQVRRRSVSKPAFLFGIDDFGPGNSGDGHEVSSRFVGRALNAEWLNELSN